VFAFSLNSTNVLIPPYFFYDPLIIEQHVFQLSIVCVFFAASFVFNFKFYCFVVRQFAGVISIFLYLLRLALCPNIWSTLEKVPCAAEKTVYCAVAGWNTP
jgi:hypothetical protein